MKVYELEKENVLNLFEPKRRFDADRSGWSKPTAAATPAPSALKLDAERRTVAIGAGGKLKLHVLDLGKLRLDKNFMVANTTVATARNPNPRGALIDIPVSAYYIEHPDGNILFDTGCHPDWSGPNGRWPAEGLQELFPHIGGEECMLPARLDRMGIGPDDVRYVVMSHLHCDHAGCVEFFRKSKIIVHEDEFAAAFRQYGLQDHASPYALKDLEAMVRAQLQWREIGRDEPDQNIVEGVRLLNFGSGHARGMLGLQVTLRSQPGVILVSDACYTADNYGPAAKLPGIAYDTLGIVRTVKRIQALAGDSGAAVWYGHDIEQFNNMRKATSGDGFYE